MKRYPEYRASGVEWIGEIPRGWSIVKVKHLTHQVIDGTHYTPEYQDGGIPFLRVTDIHTKTIDLSKVKYITPELHHELSRRCKPEKGNLLLSKNGTIGITRVIDWDFEFSIFVSLCLIKFKTETYSPYFFSYLFQSQVIDQQLRESSKTSTVTNLHLDKIRELFVVKPPISKQHAIVAFLDQKTGQIDELIRIKERRIELLQEQRTTLINQAVTKGLDPNVEMKPSGVEWIGQIPAHWESKKLGYVSTIFKGGTPKRNVDRYFQGDLPWARPVDITALKGALYINDTEIHISEEALGNSGARRIPAGTVLLTSRATIGETAITTVPMATNQGFANFVCNEQLLNVYLTY